MIIGKNVETKENVKIDLNNLIATRLLIQANSGGGKSWLLRKVLEESYGKVQQIVIDLEGEFSTLREKYDYLLAGRGADIPVNLRTAELLARKLLELNVSTIVDVSELKKHERILFVQRFLDSLLDAPRKFWHPCLIIVDEAHQFCPQASKSESASSVIDLMTRGRKRGFSGILATQRISKLHKDACAEANNRLIGRTGLDIDRKRASEELGFTSKEDERSLRFLEPGEFYGFGPSIAKEIIKVRVGNVKTTHPEPGRTLIKPSKTPDNIQKILKNVIDLPKEAEEELKTKQDFQKKIVELKREIRISKISKPKPEIDEKSLKRARDQGFKEAELQHQKNIQDLNRSYKGLEKDFNKLKQGIQQIAGNCSKLGQIEIPKLSLKPINNIPHIKSPIPIKSGTESSESFGYRSHSKIQNEAQASIKLDGETHDFDEEKQLGICAKKIYSFLFANPSREFTKPQVSFMTGYAISGNFNNAIYSLTSRNLVEKKGDLFVLGESNPEIATENQEEFRKELFTKRLPIASQKIFEILWDDPHTEFNKNELSELTGYSISGNFNNAIYKLTGLKFAVKNGNSIKLNPELLELG